MRALEADAHVLGGQIEIALMDRRGGGVHRNFGLDLPGQPFTAERRAADACSGDASRAAPYPVHPAMTKKPRARTLRREQARSNEKLARDREKLARLETGGSPDRPVVLESASQIEVHARTLRCPRCEGDLHIEEHEAPTVGERRLRLVRMVCPRCGARREAWFRIEAKLPS